jgi:hypothetical protein
VPAGCRQDETASSAGNTRAARISGYLRCVLSCFRDVRWRSDRSLDTVKTILRDNGFRGLYRGLGPTILGYLPTWAIYFAVYDGIKTFFGEPPMAGMVVDRERLYPAAQVKGYQPLVREHPWSLHILSAMTAGAASTMCTNPLWVIKTRFMVKSFSLYCIPRRMFGIAIIYTLAQLTFFVSPRPPSRSSLTDAKQRRC